MSASPFKKQLNKIVGLLSDFIPKKLYLYFPLVSSALDWAVNRINREREEILARKVWPEPGRILTKPDEFIRDFFLKSPGLSKVYGPELEKGDMETLRRAYECLYPIVGLEDPFLRALFAKELAAGHYRRIVQYCDARVRRAKQDIAAMEGDPGFWPALKSLARDAASLGTHVVSQEDVQKLIVEIIKERREGKSAPP